MAGTQPRLPPRRRARAIVKVVGSPPGVGRTPLLVAVLAACARPRSSSARGLGVIVYDAYRPLRASRAMVDWARLTGRTWLFTQGYIA